MFHHNKRGFGRSKMSPSLIRLTEYETKLVADQEVLRKAAHDLMATYQNLQFEIVCGTLEAAAKSLQAYCRAIGRCLVLAAYKRIDWSYPEIRSGGKKNTRLQRVARQGSAAAAARLSILSALRQKKWRANPGGAGRPYPQLEVDGARLDPKNLHSLRKRCHTIKMAEEARKRRRQISTACLY